MDLAKSDLFKQLLEVMLMRVKQNSCGMRENKNELKDTKTWNI